MTALAATDLTYTITKRKKLEDGRVIVNATITFGNGALTYPSGGVAVTKGKLGCPTIIDSFMIEDLGGSGYSYQYDKANVKLRLFQGSGLAAHAHDLLVKGGQAGSTTNDVAHYATDILGKEAATDATILGSASATKGGVMAVAAGTAAALPELGTSVAPAAQTIKITVIGY